MEGIPSQGMSTIRLKATDWIVHWTPCYTGNAETLSQK